MSPIRYLQLLMAFRDLKRLLLREGREREGRAGKWRARREEGGGEGRRGRVGGAIQFFASGSHTLNATE